MEHRWSLLVLLIGVGGAQVRSRPTGEAMLMEEPTVVVDMISGTIYPVWTGRTRVEAKGHREPPVTGSLVHASRHLPGLCRTGGFVATVAGCLITQLIWAQAARRPDARSAKTSEGLLQPSTHDHPSAAQAEEIAAKERTGKEIPQLYGFTGALFCATLGGVAWRTGSARFRQTGKQAASQSYRMSAMACRGQEGCAAIPQQAALSPVVPSMVMPSDGSESSLSLELRQLRSPHTASKIARKADQSRDGGPSAKLVEALVATRGERMGTGANVPLTPQQRLRSSPTTSLAKLPLPVSQVSGEKALSAARVVPSGIVARRKEKVERKIEFYRIMTEETGHSSPTSVKRHDMGMDDPFSDVSSTCSQTTEQDMPSSRESLHDNKVGWYRMSTEVTGAASGA